MPFSDKDDMAGEGGPAPASEEFLNEATFGEAASQWTAKGTFENGRFVHSHSASKQVQTVAPGRREASRTATLLDEVVSDTSSPRVSIESKTSSFALDGGRTPAAKGSETPFMQDLLDRLIRVELSLFPLRDLAGQITNLRTDVDFLLRAQRQQGTGQAANSPTPSSISKSPSMTSLPYANGHASVTSAASNETKASIATLSAQLSGLTQSVAQLMSSHETQATPRARPPLPLLPPSSNSIVSQRNISGSSTASAQPSLAERWAPVTALLAPALSQALLSLPALGPPTKIQLKAIPCLIAASKEDIVCQASSALEGLVSYSLSAIHVASIGPSQAATAVVVVCSSLDRAALAQRLITELGAGLGIRAGLVQGRAPSEDAAMLQRNRPHIVVGTAQGLIELLTMRVLAQGGTLRMLVLDEADVMVSSNQLDLLMHLMRLLPMPSPSASAGFDPWADTMKVPERQTAIFGAVIHPELLNFASALQLKEPVRVLVKKAATNSTVDSPQIGGPLPGAEVALLKNMKHHYLYVAIASRPQGGKRASSAEAWKLEAVADFLEDGDFTQAIAFCATAEAVEALSFKLASRGIDALALNAEMGPQTRTSILSKFRSPPAGSASLKRVLVVLEMLCRTLTDLQQVPLVVNFDISSPEVYVHQAVRASAAAANYRPGSVVNVCCSDEDVQRLKHIESYFGLRLQEVPLHREL